jgi:cysteine desulfurase
MRVFLDHASTTPLRPEAKSALTDALELTGNPSSVHASGQQTRALVEDARDQVAQAAGCNRSEVVFTSGGTEANNQAIKGLFWASGKKLIISSPLEHHAVIDPIQWLEQNQGAEVYWLKVDRDGQVDLADLQSVLNARALEVALIALMWVNNETGVVTDIPAVTSIANKFNVPVHSDAVAAFGNISIDFASAGLSTMAISGHKVGAPIGVGALIVGRDQKPSSLVHGGSQERSLRSGTLSYPMIASFGAASAAASADLDARKTRLLELRDELEAKVLVKLPNAMVTVANSTRSFHTAHFIFPGAQSDNLLFLLDQAGISASAGSACTAGVLAPSHVLLAMGIEPELADCSIRVSLGHSTTKSDIDAFVYAIETAYPVAVLEAANQKAI